MFQQGGNWSNTGGVVGDASIPLAKQSHLGLVSGGTTNPAGSALPATAGDFILDPIPAAETWVRITGTAAAAGDTVLTRFGGNAITAPLNPAKRYTTARLPGEPGTFVLGPGVIEISNSSTNPDSAVTSWVLVKN